LQLYELAMEHGKKRNYAKAERVFRHLAARDPGYRDVAIKLEKLSGARGVVPPAPRPVRSPPLTEAAAPAMSPAGRTLGRYELERVIGRGAMATVYLGRDPTINRRVAIKTLPLAEEFAETDLAAARSNFLREAESAGRLNHPYIISIHDAGEDNQVAYLAMEYFEGKPLSHYAQLGRLLPPKVVFELMARAAEALDYAHSQNVVHRDVKPANLMYDVTSDRLKLTDFGIARLTDASRTRTGIILGTPSYMSPEQLSASKVSGQTDLYSLGVTMYHLLTGAPPFQADSIPRLMDKIVHHRHRPISDIRDDVPACADVILERALAKNPADRFESGKAMALALRECCSTFPSEVI
jgi:serine/threonine-protein kinase